MIWAPVSVFHSRFFAPLRCAKRAPFKPGRGFVFPMEVFFIFGVWKHPPVRRKKFLFLKNE